MSSKGILRRCLVSSTAYSCCMPEAIFISLNKTAPDVFHDHFEKVNHQKATRANGQNIKIPKIKTESAKRGLYYSGVKIYNALPTHLKTERSYLRFKQGLKEHFMD